MKKISFLIILLIIIINISAFTTMAYHRWMKTPNECTYKHNNDNYLCQQLSLSDSQKQQINLLSHDFHSQADSIGLIILEKQNEMLSALEEKKPDYKKIEQIVKKITTLQAAIQGQVINHLIAEKNIFNEDQQKKFFTILRTSLQKEAICNRNKRFNLINDFDDKCEDFNKCPIEK